MFDEFEPIGTRTVPDLLALLLALTANIHRKAGTRAHSSLDFLANPLSPRRLSAPEEKARGMAVMGDYRRLRAERLARKAEEERQAAG